MCKLPAELCAFDGANRRELYLRISGRTQQPAIFLCLGDSRIPIFPRHACCVRCVQDTTIPQFVKITVTRSRTFILAAGGAGPQRAPSFS